VYNLCRLHFGEAGRESLLASIRLDTKYANLFRVLDQRCQTNATAALTPEQRIDLLNGPEEELTKKVIGSKLALCTRTLLVCM
jgi:hypothetical protein